VDDIEVCEFDVSEVVGVCVEVVDIVEVAVIAVGSGSIEVVEVVGRMTERGFSAKSVLINEICLLK
jgi:hypothetical protein